MGDLSIVMFHGRVPDTKSRDSEGKKTLTLMEEKEHGGDIPVCQVCFTGDQHLRLWSSIGFCTGCPGACAQETLALPCTHTHIYPSSWCYSESCRYVFWCTGDMSHNILVRGFKHTFIILYMMCIYIYTNTHLLIYIHIHPHLDRRNKPTIFFSTCLWMLPYVQNRLNREACH